MTLILASTLFLLVLAYGYWRYVWFVRNPARTPPPGESLLSAADGTVVYVTRLQPRQDVIVIKKGRAAKIGDIVREDVDAEKLLIGVFMSPFNVHCNRAPLSGTVEFVRHHLAQGGNLAMWRMHLRTLLKRPPYYKNSLHVVQNERTVTKINGRFKDQPLSCYVIQIAGRSVRGIQSFVEKAMPVERGATFGMIRIGSQVDVVIPWREGMQVLIQPGDTVRAGETALVC